LINIDVVDCNNGIVVSFARQLNGVKVFVFARAPLFSRCNAKRQFNYARRMRAAICLLSDVRRVLPCGGRGPCSSLTRLTTRMRQKRDTTTTDMHKLYANDINREPRQFATNSPRMYETSSVHTVCEGRAAFTVLLS
jgi:hypothetical protein